MPDPSVRQQIEWCRKLSEAVINEKGETAGIRKLRSIAPKFISGCRRCREYRRKLAVEPRTKEELFAMLDLIEEKAGGETAGPRSPGEDEAYEHGED